MDKRFKQLRLALKLTQSDFGKKVGVKGNTITNYETGLRNPSDAVIHSICKEFNVNEKWLRYGEGDMFIELTRDEEVFAYVQDLLDDDSRPFSKFVKDFIVVYEKLDDTGKDYMDSLISDLLERSKKES